MLNRPVHIHFLLSSSLGLPGGLPLYDAWVSQYSERTPSCQLIRPVKIPNLFQTLKGQNRRSPVLPGLWLLRGRRKLPKGKLTSTDNKTWAKLFTLPLLEDPPQINLHSTHGLALSLVNGHCPRKHERHLYSLCFTVTFQALDVKW